MWHASRPGSDFFAALVAADRHLVDAAQELSCPWCGAALHRRDYPRKPRGGLLAQAGERFRVRFGLCCSREGCRKSVLPPSLRFLGRRVYLEAIILLGCLHALVVGAVHGSEATTGVPARTMARWLSWWSVDFVASPRWQWMRARFMPPVDESQLPRSFIERVAGGLGDANGVEDVLEMAARWLAPLTTSSMRDVASFVRVG